MRILAFDTCFGAVSVAVRTQTGRGETVLHEDYEERDIGHAERLIPMIDGVLIGAGLRAADIDRLAVTIGPGTFTGLRVGIAAARALALATGAPVVSTTSLALMAARADDLLGTRRGSRKLIVAVDARRGRLYAQVFGDKAGDASTAAELSTPAELAAKLAAEPLFAVGSGAQALADAAPGRIEAALPTLQPHARFLALLAPELRPAGAPVPLYLRDADAKPQTGKSLTRASS